MLGIIISNQNTKKIGEKNKKNREFNFNRVPIKFSGSIIEPKKKKKNQVGFARHIMRRKVGPN